MHVLNRFLDKGAGFYNDPERAAFFKKHKNVIMASGLAAITGCIALSYSIGVTTFLAVVGLNILGASTVFPSCRASKEARSLFQDKGYPWIQNPGTGPCLGAVISLLPLLEPEGPSKHQ